MKIADLRHHPEPLETLARWHQQEWSCLNPGETLAGRIERMEQYLVDALVPSTFVALEHGQPVGSAAIVDDDMDTRPELGPWLASVFVAPPHRRRGIGGRLVRHVMETARSSGIGALYLFTADQERFYAALGWTVLVREPYRGHDVTIMRAALGG